jgi:hypothetical protein
VCSECVTRLLFADLIHAVQSATRPLSLSDFQSLIWTGYCREHDTLLVAQGSYRHMRVRAVLTPAP